MTAEYPAETTIATHTNGARPHVTNPPGAPRAARGAARRIVLSALLALTALVVLRRIQGGASAS